MVSKLPFCPFVFQVSHEFARLHVYYKSLKSEVIAETPMVTTRQFINNLGGALSLWLGISFVTILEVVELIIDVAFVLFKSVGTIFV